MLTDIFAIRYETIPLFKVFSRREKRVLHQCFTLLEELYPYCESKDSERERCSRFWKTAHQKVANELGERWLSEPRYTVNVGVGDYRRRENRKRDDIEICRTWMLSSPREEDSDEFVKNRISLVEVGLREAIEEVDRQNNSLERNEQLAYLMKGTYKKREEMYSSAANELNVRFLNAKIPLHYHNGYIQITRDDKVTLEIEQPFWSAVSSPEWENVDLDMKEAIDQRDSGAKDPAIYAAKALESTIKIISDGLETTHGKESGAHNYIDNLRKKAIAFVEPWEAELLKSYFTKVRNPLGHGPGNEPMPTLSYEQSSWAIETAMSWIKLLVGRFNIVSKVVSS